MGKHCKYLWSFGQGDLKISRKKVSSIAMKTVNTYFPKLNVPIFTLKACQVVRLS